MADIIYSNIRELNRRLDMINVKLKRELQSEAKKPAKKIQAAIVKAIPANSPFAGKRKDGFTHRGRTSWQGSINPKGNRVPPKSVSISFRSAGSKRTLITSLVRVVVNSPAVAIADTAKRARTPQGAAFVSALNSSLGGSPSRIVWKSIEGELPAVEAEVRMVLDKYTKMVRL
jgi:hypothetical protein